MTTNMAENANSRIANIDNQLKELRSKKQTITNNAKSELQKILSQHLDNDIEIRSLSDNRFTFGFVSGTWPNTNDPQYTEIEMYIGYNDMFRDKNVSDADWYTDDNFKMELNPFTGGSFNVIASKNDTKSEWRLRKYFAITGMVILQHEFNTALKNILKKYVDDIRPINMQGYELSDEISRIKREDAAEQSRIADEIETNNINKKLSDNNYKYAVIRKGSDNGNHHIYRKNSVKVMDVYVTNDEAKADVSRRNKGYVASGVKYSVVDASKIKQA